MNSSPTDRKRNAPCQMIDDFLAGDLTGAEEIAFAQHLASCATCTTTVEQQRWIDGLLGSRESRGAEVLSSGVLAAVGQRISGEQQRRAFRQRTAMVAAAAAIVVAITWQFAWQRPDEAAPLAGGGSADGALAVTSPRTARSSVTAAPVAVKPQAATFSASGDAIAIPLASDDAQVSIVQLYPTLPAERRWRRELYTQAGDAGQDGG